MEFPPQRQSQSVPTCTTTGLTVFSLPWRIEPGRHSLTVVVKATLDIVPDGVARLRDEADPPSGDLCFDDDPNGSVLHPSDFAYIKPHCDVVLTGHAFATKRGAQAAHVRFAFGKSQNGFDRRIAVFGARHWTTLGLTAPRSFETVPLIYERAFGGEQYQANPVGIGIDGASLPQLETPSDLIMGPTDRPEPACFAGYSQSWAVRRNKLGTYDEHWARDHYPFFPADFDATYFQAAPPAQQLAAIQGDEPFILQGMHAEFGCIEGRLPDLHPRCFIQAVAQAGADFTELELRLDTVAFNTDEMKVNLVWRALLDVSDFEASELAELYLLLEGENEDISLAEASERYRIERMLMDGTEQLESVPPPANTSPEYQNEALAAHDQRVRERLLEQGLPAALLSSTKQQTEVAPPPPAPSLPDRDNDEVRIRVIALLAVDGNLNECDLSNGDLSELDFSSRCLVGADFTNSRLVGSRFDQSDLRGAILAGCNMSDASLADAKLQQADFSRSVLDGAVMVRAEFGDTDFSDASATHLDARQTRGERPTFAGANLSHAQFNEAQITKADFIATKLDGASFESAILPDIFLYDAQGKVSFKGATIENARADGASLAESHFGGVTANGSVFDGADLSACNFFSSSLRGVGLVKANCAEILLGGCDLSEARMARADLSKANLIKANLMKASIEAANLSGADLRGANLYAAEVFEANLDGADLTDALIGKTKLEAR